MPLTEDLQPPRPALPEGLAPPDAGDDLIGQMAGSFRIVRRIGQGGMGAIYLGEHPIIGNRVAIKFLHPWLAGDPDLLFRFYQEARAAHLVGHENIVGIRDLNKLPPSRYYIVMEHLEGETLAQRLLQGSLPLDVTLHVLLQLCSALQAAHDAGVVHRDLKPENVFLVKHRGDESFVKLVDFGIAKLQEPGPGVTRGLVVGTPEYMAPEQVDGRVADARTDVYALGVLAYRLVTGRLPFQGGSLAQLLHAQLAEAAVPPHELDPAVPPRLSYAVSRALQKGPDDRFVSARAFGDELRAVQASLADGGAALSPRHLRLVATPPPPQAPDDTPTAVGLSAELLGEDGAVRRTLAFRHLSPDAVFLCSGDEPPPLFSAVCLRIGAGPAQLTVRGDVVRHVTRAQAAAWRCEPGFAVEFTGATADARARLRALAGAQPPCGERDAEADAFLDRFPSDGTHYEVLGLEPDAEFADVSARGTRLRCELAALRARRLSPPQAHEAQALAERIEAAVTTLSSLERRAEYDAMLGNYLGVARAIAARLPLVRVDELRKVYLAARPEVPAEVDTRLARIRLASVLGNHPAALRELESALRLDPLNRLLHERWAEAQGSPTSRAFAK